VLYAFVFTFEIMIFSQNIIAMSDIWSGQSHSMVEGSIMSLGRGFDFRAIHPIK
jgi:hypothetical protein